MEYHEICRIPWNFTPIFFDLMKLDPKKFLWLFALTMGENSRKVLWEANFCGNSFCTRFEHKGPEMTADLGPFFLARTVIKWAYTSLIVSMCKCMWCRNLSSKLEPSSTPPKYMMSLTLPTSSISGFIRQNRLVGLVQTSVLLKNTFGSNHPSA